MERLAIDGGIPVRDKKIFYSRQWIDEEDVKTVSEGCGIGAGTGVIYRGGARSGSIKWDSSSTLRLYCGWY